MTGRRELRIGVVLEAFTDRPLPDTLAWLRRAAPQVTHVEVGAGGYAPHPHCDVAALLGSARARTGWLDGIARHGMAISALNAWGNPLHPDAELARRHDQDLRNAIRLAAELGVDRVVALAGCPAGGAGDQVPHFGAGGWLPYLEGVYERQWEQQIGPYWAGLAEFAAAVHPELGGQPDRVAEILVMPLGQPGVRVQRVAPGVERADRHLVPGYPVLPRRPGLRAAQQRGHVAVRVRSVSAGPDLDVRDLRRRTPQPGQGVLQRPVGEGLQHHADAQLPTARHLAESGCGAYDLSRYC